jgi:hypothetical protein
MAAILFLCPNTGYCVQEWFADDAENGDNAYQTVTCLICQRVHLINRSGKVLGTDEE